MRFYGYKVMRFVVIRLGNYIELDPLPNTLHIYA